MKKHIPILLCILLGVSVLFNIGCAVKFHSDRKHREDSLMTEIFGHASDLQDTLRDMIEAENYSRDSMRKAADGFYVLSDLFRYSRDIYYDAQDDFSHMGCSFMGSGSFDIGDITGIYGDETVTENEIEYLKKLIEILDKTLLNVYTEKKNTYHMDILNDNLASVHELLSSREDSPFLLIKSHT